MNDDIFTQKNWDDLVKVLKNEMGQAVWDTLHVTLISSFFAILIGLPLGILLVVGDKKGLRPFPRPIMFFLNTIINLIACGLIQFLETFRFYDARSYGIHTDIHWCQFLGSRFS